MLQTGMRRCLYAGTQPGRDVGMRLILLTQVLLVNWYGIMQ